MDSNLKKPIRVEDVPSIPRYLQPSDFQLLIPQGYEEFMEVELNEINPEKPSIILRIKKAEMATANTIEIPLAYFNGEMAEVEVPLFLLETSTVKTGVDYFGKDNHLILNMNQLIYLTIQHRLADYARIIGKSDRKIYVALLRSDLRALRNFIQFEKPNTHNAKKKVENIYSILPYKVHKYSSDIIIGENFKFNNLSEKDWKRIYKDIGKYLQFTSESSMQESNKVVLNPLIKSLYKAPGYSLAKDGTCFTSIFPPAQNVPARNKTHVLTNGCELDKADRSYIQQLNHFENGVITPLDDTRKAIVVFHPMNKETLRFVAGELEVSTRIATALITEYPKFDLDFKEESDIKVKVGETYHPEFKPFSLGLDLNGEDYNVYQLKDIEILSIAPNGMAGNYRITARTTKFAGNSRIVSQSGLKGVTKVKPDNGVVAFAPKNTIMDSLDDKELAQYLSDRNYNSYRTIDPKQLKGWKKRNVDIVTGMNAVKAGSNTIALAQACLAVELGYYVPSLKGAKKEYANILNSLDPKEINDAANSLPEFVYINDDGIPSKCFVGLVDIVYTELGSTYAKFKPQSFSFEAGWVVKQNQPELFEHIFSNYLETDKNYVTLELYEILQDPQGLLRADNNLPRYNVAQIRKNMFNIKEDMFRQFNTLFKSRSKLLSQEWNPKGFYIDLTKEKGPLIRIPSAETLNFFVSVLPNGEYSYGEILFNISKIIMAILGRHDGNLSIDTENSNINFNSNLHWIFTNNPENKRSMLYDAYMKNIKGLVYSSETSHRMLIQSFIKPRIPGASLKQVVDCMVPDNVIVYLNPHLYKKMLYQSGYERIADPDQPYLPLLQEASALNTNELRLQFKEAVQQSLDDVPSGILNRNPFLTC